MRLQELEVQAAAGAGCAVAAAAAALPRSLSAAAVAAGAAPTILDYIPRSEHVRVVSSMGGRDLALLRRVEGRSEGGRETRGKHVCAAACALAEAGRPRTAGREPGHTAPGSLCLMEALSFPLQLESRLAAKESDMAVEMNSRVNQVRWRTAGLLSMPAGLATMVCMDAWAGGLLNELHELQLGAGGRLP